MAKAQPLAARMRPRSLDEFVGQEHFLGPGKLLRRLLQADRLGSVIFYGPPGTGKTALAHVIANQTQCQFRQLNAVAAGIKEDSALQSEYIGYPSLTNVMPFYSTGTETGFDSLLVDFTKDELLVKIRRFLDSRKTDAEIAAEFSVGEGTGRKLLKTRKEFRKDFESNGSNYCVR